MAHIPLDTKVELIPAGYVVDSYLDQYLGRYAVNFTDEGVDGFDIALGIGYDYMAGAHVGG